MTRWIVPQPKLKTTALVGNSLVAVFEPITVNPTVQQHCRFSVSRKKKKKKKKSSSNVKSRKRNDDLSKTFSQLAVEEENEYQPKQSMHMVLQRIPVEETHTFHLSSLTAHFTSPSLPASQSIQEHIQWKTTASVSLITGKKKKGKKEAAEEKKKSQSVVAALNSSSAKGEETDEASVEVSSKGDEMAEQLKVTVGAMPSKVKVAEEEKEASVESAMKGNETEKQAELSAISSKDNDVGVAAEDEDRKNNYVENPSPSKIPWWQSNKEGASVSSQS